MNNIKECIKRMNETDNIQYARDAVTIYNNSLKPLLDKIRHLKYNQCMVLHNEETNTCNLIQSTFTNEDLLYSNFKSKIVSYNIGKQPMAKKNTTLIVMNDLSSTSSSEDNINKNIPIVQATQNVTKPPQTNREVHIPEDEPIYGKGKDGVAWSLHEYDVLWNNLPVKLKNVLKTDKDWMKLFMFNCVNALANNKMCNFTSPPELKLPPNQIELPDGKYDFGVPIYNEVFNKLSEKQKKAYLSFYSQTFYKTKDGKYATKDGKELETGQEKVENVQERKYDDNLFKNVMNKHVAIALDFNPNSFK
jgi:hypothetical protein